MSEKTGWIGASLRRAGLVSIGAITVLGIAGCGGGGGGSGGELPALVYSGNTSQAVVTPFNASRLTANVIGSDDTAGTILGVSVEGGNATQYRGSGLADLTRRLSREFRDTAARAKQASSAQQVAPGVAVNETESCVGGGSVRTFGTLDDFNGTGTLTVVFSNCVMDGDTLNGQGTIRVDGVDFSLNPPLPTNFTVSFPRLTLRGPGVSVDAGGSLGVSLTTFVNIETITANLVHLDNNAGRMTKTENLVFVNVYDNIFFPTRVDSSTVNGQAFDQVLGFVVIATPLPLRFNSISQLFPDVGQLLLTGAANSSVLVTAVDSLIVMLELDTDGDTVVDNTARMRWTELSGPVGDDLGDTDGDGMHNSWETARSGFSPTDPSDALLDNDNDGATNLMEYVGGSDPSDQSSIPAAVNLSLSMQDTPDPVNVGNTLAYTIVVENFSVVAASNVVVTDTLPASVNLVSAAPSQGSCSGTTSLTCNLGPIGGFVNASIIIQVMPTMTGVISNTATVTSNSFDFSTSNNSATNATTVN